MGEALNLAILLTLKDEASAHLGGVTDKMSGLGKAALAVGGLAVAGIGALAGVLATSIGPAKDLSETVSKVGIVFGEQSGVVLAFGETASNALGMSENAALTAAGTYGNLFRAMGMTTDTSAEMSIGLVNLASDLASFNNMDPTLVLDKLRAGLSGETEPLRSLGVNLNVATITAKAMEMGLVGVSGELTASAKAQASYALIMEQTGLAQGDFARTSSGLANQQRILGASMTNLRATIGTALLPTMSAMAAVAVDLAQRAMPWVAQASKDLQAGLSTAFTWIKTNVGPIVTEVTGKLATLAQQAMPWVETASKNLKAAIDTAFAWVKTTVVPIIEDFVRVLGTIATWVATNTAPIIAGMVAIGVVIMVHLAPAFGIWAAAAATAAATTLAAIAPIVAIGAAVALLAMAWTKDFLGIRTAVTQWWDVTLKPIFEQVKEWFEVNIPVALAFLKAQWDAIWPPIQALLEAVWAALEPVFQKIGDFLSIAIPAALTVLQGIWAAVWPAIQAVLVACWEFMSGTVERLMRVIQDVIAIATGLIKGDWTMVWNAIKDILAAVWEQMRAAVVLAIGLIKGIISAAWAAIQAEVGVAWAAIKGVIISAWDAIKTAIGAALDAIRAWIIDKWNSIMAFFNGLPGQMRSIGSAIIQGLWDGMTAVWNNLVTWAQGLASKLAGIITGAKASANAAAGTTGTAHGTSAANLPFGGSYARGGTFVTPPGGVLIAVGEAGPELVNVIPEESMGAGAGGKTILDRFGSYEQGGAKYTQYGQEIAGYGASAAANAGTWFSQAYQFSAQAAARQVMPQIAHAYFTAQAAGRLPAYEAAQAALVAGRFAKGGDFVTNGPMLMEVGEAGPERVQVTPLGKGSRGGGGGLTFVYSPTISMGDRREAETVIAPLLLSILRKEARRA